MDSSFDLHLQLVHRRWWMIRCLSSRRDRISMVIRDVALAFETENTAHQSRPKGCEWNRGYPVSLPQHRCIPTDGIAAFARGVVENRENAPTIHHNSTWHIDTKSYRDPSTRSVSSYFRDRSCESYWGCFPCLSTTGQRGQWDPHGADANGLDSVWFVDDARRSSSLDNVWYRRSNWLPSALSSNQQDCATVERHVHAHQSDVAVLFHAIHARDTRRPSTRRQREDPDHQGNQSSLLFLLRSSFEIASLQKDRPQSLDRSPGK